MSKYLRGTTSQTKASLSSGNRSEDFRRSDLFRGVSGHRLTFYPSFDIL